METRRLGVNRGKARCWVEGQVLEPLFKKGDFFAITIGEGSLTLRKVSGKGAALEPGEESRIRKVSGKVTSKGTTPIIDLAGSIIEDTFQPTENPTVTVGIVGSYRFPYWPADESATGGPRFVIRSVLQ